MPLSDAYEDAVLDHILGTTELTFDSTIYLALGSDTTPNKTTFTEITTAGTLGYARKAIVFNASGTDGIAEGPSTGSGTITFGPCTDTPWGTLKSFALYTASTGGTRITQGALTDQTKTVGVGDSATFAEGSIVVTAS